jgi:hypothetical protein
MRENIVFPYLPDSGSNDQKFDFWADETTFTRHLTDSVDESIASIEKLLSKRPQSIRELIKETGQSKDLITKAVAKMVEKSRCAIDSFKTVDSKTECQLKLFDL